MSSWNKASSDWEDLHDDDDNNDKEPPPSGFLYVDRTPLAPASHKKSLHVATGGGLDPYSDEKTPLISHKSSSGLNSLDKNHKKVPPSSVIKEESSSFLWDATDTDDDDNRSHSSVASSWSTASSVVTLSTQYLGNFKNSLLIPFTDDTGTPGKLCSGLLALTSVGVVLGLIMPKDEHLTPDFRSTSSILGYTYMVCWSVCFYPQVILNYKRNSTLGLSHDFVVLNILGWTCFSLYECAMYFDDNIKQLYRQRFKARDNTVQSNDVLFALHAMILAWIYIIQIIWYKTENDGRWAIRIKRQTWILSICVLTPTIVVPLLIVSNVLPFEKWLDYFYMLSFLKISCTLTKYTKQVLFNMERQSTKGWNIWYNFLEGVGGTLSMLQVVLDAVDLKDWSGVTGNIAKFVLGFLTIFFDILFLLQHYVIYPQPTVKQDEKDSANIRQDVANMKIDMTYSMSIEDLSLPEQH